MSKISPLNETTSVFFFLFYVEFVLPYVYWKIKLISMGQAIVANQTLAPFYELQCNRYRYPLICQRNVPELFFANVYVDTSIC